MGFQTFSVIYLCRRFGGGSHLNLEVKFLSHLSTEPPQSNAIGLCSQLLPSLLSKVLASFSFVLHIFFSISFSVFLFYILLGVSKSNLVPLWQKNPFLVCANHFHFIVCFLLGNSPASEFYIPTFRNTLSVPSS